MLAPVDDNTAAATHTFGFDAMLNIARAEALAVLRQLLIETDIPVPLARERRMAATAILRIKPAQRAEAKPGPAPVASDGPDAAVEAAPRDSQPESRSVDPSRPAAQPTGAVAHSAGKAESHARANGPDASRHSGPAFSPKSPGRPPQRAPGR